MKKFTRWLTLALIVGLGSAGPWTGISAGEGNPLSDLPHDPAIHVGILPNGLRWAWMTNPQPQDKVAIRLHVIAGSLDEADPERGLAHFLEHMAFNGTTSYPPGTLVPRLQERGIAFGAHSNAHTSFDETVYKLDLPDHRPETIQLGLNIMAETAGGMLLVPEEVLRERGVILSEMRDRDGPDRRTWQRLYATAYAGTTIAQRFPIGVSETVGAADAARVGGFYRRMYQPQRMVLSVVGAIDAQIEESIAKHCSALPEIPDGVVPGAYAQAGLLPGRAATVLDESEANSLTIHLARLRTEIPPTDSVATRRADLHRDIAMRIVNKRFATAIESDPQCPVLSANAWSRNHFGIAHVWVSAAIRPGRQTDALAFIEAGLRSLRQYGPTTGEVALERTKLSSELDRAVAQVDTRQSGSLAQSIAGALADRVALLSPSQYRDLVSPWLVAMDVATIKQELRRVWGDDAGARDICVLEGHGAGATTVEALQTMWAAAVAAVVTPPPERNDGMANVWAYPQLSGAIAGQEALSPTITAVRLANGAVAMVRSATAQPNHVMISARLHHAPDEQSVAARGWFAQAFVAGALGRHDARSLREVLAGTSINGVRAETFEDGTGLSIECLPADIGLAMRVLCAFLTDPGWRPQPATTARVAWLQALEAEKTDLAQTVNRRFTHLFTGGMAERLPPTSAQVEAAEWGRVQAWYTPVLSQAPLTIAVSGDVTLAAVQTALAGSFAALPQRQPIVVRGLEDRSWLHPSPIPASTLERVTISANKPQAIVTVGWPISDMTDITQYRRAGVLAGCLSDRMRLRIREELGIAYSPYANRWASDVYAGSGWVSAVVQCDPDKADQALAEIRQLAATMAREGVSAELLDQIKTPLTRNLLATMNTNGWWMATLARGAEQPFRLTWAENLASEVAAISRADLSALATAVFNPHREITVIGIARP